MATLLGRYTINNFIEIYEFTFMYSEISCISVSIYRKLAILVDSREEA